MSEPLWSPLCGIFIGGKSRRMGGHPKGLLPAPSPPQPSSAPRPASLVERLAALLHGQGLTVVLVGQHADYAGLGLPILTDQPPGHGPLGGLMALLCAAAQQGRESVIALSCDLPFFDLPLLTRLLRANPTGYDAVAPRWTPPDRAQPIWEPLCARYLPSFTPGLAAALSAVDPPVPPSLQRLLAQARTLALPLAEDELAQVKDWDSPSDLPDGIRASLRPESG